MCAPENEELLTYKEGTQTVKDVVIVNYRRLKIKKNYVIYSLELKCFFIMST